MSELLKYTNKSLVLPKQLTGTCYLLFCHGS